MPRFSRPIYDKDEKADMCDECLEPIFPVTGQAVCADCTAGRDDFEP